MHDACLPERCRTPRAPLSLALSAHLGRIWCSGLVLEICRTMREKSASRWVQTAAAAAAASKTLHAPGCSQACSNSRRPTRPKQRHEPVVNVTMMVKMTVMPMPLPMIMGGDGEDVGGTTNLSSSAYVGDDMHTTGRSLEADTATSWQMD